MPNLPQLPDDQPLYYIRRDLSAGMNNRAHGSNIGENQATVLYNADISVPGQSTKRPGNDTIDTVDATPSALGVFMPQGGTNQLVVIKDTDLDTSSGGTFTNRKNNFTATTRPTIIQGGESGLGDVLFIGNGTDNWFRMDASYNFQDLGSTSGAAADSPPKSNVGSYFRSRLWVLKSNKLYYSDAFDDDYSTAFDTASKVFNMPVGTEQALIGLRDAGLICFGTDKVYGINPSATPAATDKPEKLFDRGTPAGNTVVQAGDDVYFLSQDGIRGLFRTQQDKLQIGTSDPISFAIREEWESLSWAYIGNACAVYFDNKIFFSVPVDASTYNNEVWVYYPATKGWMVITGWNVGSWAKITISGEERLYFTDSNSGKVRRAWTGYDDDGTAINYLEESRKDDLGQPLVTKTGGYLKIKALAVGNYDLTVSASVDDQGYIVLGTMNLNAEQPTLPVALPFPLADTSIKEDTFPLDELGSWKLIRIKIQHNATNGTDYIRIYERNLVTYADEYVP